MAHGILRAALPLAAAVLVTAGSVRADGTPDTSRDAEVREIMLEAVRDVARRQEAARWEAHPDPVVNWPRSRFEPLIAVVLPGGAAPDLVVPAGRPGPQGLGRTSQWITAQVPVSGYCPGHTTAAGVHLEVLAGPSAGRSAEGGRSARLMDVYLWSFEAMARACERQQGSAPVRVALASVDLRARIACPDADDFVETSTLELSVDCVPPESARPDGQIVAAGPTGPSVRWRSSPTTPGTEETAILTSHWFQVTPLPEAVVVRPVLEDGTLGAGVGACREQHPRGFCHAFDVPARIERPGGEARFVFESRFADGSLRTSDPVVVRAWTEEEMYVPSVGPAPKYIGQLYEIVFALGAETCAPEHRPRLLAMDGVVGVTETRSGVMLELESGEREEIDCLALRE